MINFSCTQPILKPATLKNCACPSLCVAIPTHPPPPRGKREGWVRLLVGYACPDAETNGHPPDPLYKKIPILSDSTKTEQGNLQYNRYQYPPGS